MKKIENVKAENTNIEALLAKLPIKTTTYYLKKHKDGFALAIGTLSGKPTKDDEDDNNKHNIKQLQSILDAFASTYGVSNVTYRWIMTTQIDAHIVPNIRLQIFSNANESGEKLVL